MNMIKDNIINELKNEIILYHGSKTQTIKNYTTNFEKFLEWYEKNIESIKSKKQINRIKVETIKEFIVKILNKYQSGHYARSMTASIKFYYMNCAKRTSIKNIKLPRVKNKEQIFLSEQEIKKLYLGCKNLKEKLIISLLFSSAIRVSEAVNLVWDEIDYENKTVFVKFGKGNKFRYANLSDESIYILKEYYKVTNSNYVLARNYDGKKLTTRTIQAYLNNIGQRTINKKITPHTLRRSCANITKKMGININKIKNVLGHSSINTTKTYLSRNNHDDFRLETNPMDFILKDDGGVIYSI